MPLSYVCVTEVSKRTEILFETYISTKSSLVIAFAEIIRHV